MSSHVTSLATTLFGRVKQFKETQPFISGIIVGVVGSFLFSFLVH